MNVLMVSSEAVPFCKTGGLADVVGALSAALISPDVDVRILLPLYGSIKQDGMEETGLFSDVLVCGKREHVTFLHKKVGKVLYYFVSHPWYTRRSGVYGDTSFAPYVDNLQRFTLLDKAAFALCKELAWKPDILHAHDWTCGFVPYILKTQNDPFFKGTKSVITIHNLAYQGDFSRLDFLKADLPYDERLFVGFGSEKRCNMLKSGLEFADQITTVSPTYAKEIQEEAYGCHLDQLLASRQKELTGILNGIDYDEWNPETDKALPYHFSAKDLSGKRQMKLAVQKEFALPVDPDIPLIAMISRIADQKGFTELLEGSPCALENILQNDNVQMIIIGTGDKQMEKRLEEIGRQNANLSVNILFNGDLAHRLEAGADYFLMPSRFEPCGLNQMYSLHYGTVPIARKTGGLADSIIDQDENPEQGTGFLFQDLDATHLVSTVERALTHYDTLDAMRKRGMRTDVTWTHSALCYLKIYGVK